VKVHVHERGKFVMRYVAHMLEIINVLVNLLKSLLSNKGIMDSATNSK
jgi:hypothetical protein